MHGVTRPALMGMIFNIATGGRNWLTPIPGLDLEGIYDLRTVSDADRIRSEIAPCRKAVIVGMGFIGIETHKMHKFH
jgi:NAD(P)H-nitrite reductase large subunit